MRLFSRAAAVRLGIAALLLGTPLLWAWWTMIRMPGRSHRRELPPATAAQRALAGELQRDVAVLAADLGERHLQRPRQLAAAADAIERALQQAGYRVERQTFAAGEASADNLVAERAGAAHYHQPSDTVDQVDFASLARVVDGLDAVLVELLDG